MQQEGQQRASPRESDAAVPEEEAASPQTSGNCEEEERASSCLRHEMRQHLPHISK